MPDTTLRVTYCETCCEELRKRRAPMRSRRSISGWLLGDTKAYGRRVTSKASEGISLAHVEGGSGRSEASSTAILQDTHSVEGLFCEVRSTEF
jgi:hypothetical protein